MSTHAGYAEISQGLFSWSTISCVAIERRHVLRLDCATNMLLVEVASLDSYLSIRIIYLVEPSREDLITVRLLHLIERRILLVLSTCFGISLRRLGVDGVHVSW